MSATLSQVASAALISPNANRRLSSQSRKGRGIVSLETHERLSVPSGTSNRRLKRTGSLQPTSTRPVQTRRHTKTPTPPAKKRKEKKHSRKELYKQAIVLQQTVIDDLRAQTLERPHQCPECSKSFKRTDHVRSHIRIRHLELVSSLDKTYCEKCEKRFARPMYLTQHTCGTKPCRKCADLTWIMSILMKIILATLPAARSLRCEQCQVDLSSPASLTRHMNTKRHRDVVGQSMDQGLSLVQQEGARCPRELAFPHRF